MIIDMTVSAMERNLERTEKKKSSSDWNFLNLDWGVDNLPHMVINGSVNFEGAGAEFKFGDGITITSNDGGNITFDAPVTFNSNVTFNANTKWTCGFWSNAFGFNID